MLDNKLTYQQLADVSGYALSTIRGYMLPITSKAHRNVSNRALDLITHKIDSRGRV
jgi:hypothetical protein